MSPFRIDREGSDTPSRELKKGLANRDAKGEPVADRELTDAELFSVSAAGNEDLGRGRG
jgi:hypothetical protein